MYEELLTDKETTLPTHHPKILKASVEKIDSDVILATIEKMIRSLYQLSKDDIIKIISDIIPEYKRTKPKDLSLKLSKGVEH